ncbi:DNA polymerase III subunit delta' [uncultured Brachyspira sp.]|uniref:DNA polymerase III subunit delta' n=1 Tax=uncultured Brachyspira sp. TaxID=221953 RepID=UPI00262C8676|nr:DNA polymerase III subunit delta' [uncultured Brachyspira sp.]
MAKVLGQTTPLKIMSGIYKSGRLHHAYLFYGDEGVGKFESALNYAKAILCERNNGTYCDECKSCKMIDQYKHPDVIVAGTDERFRNAELYFNQYLEYKLPHLFNNFYTSCRSILYKVESMLFDSYDNYPSSEPKEYMLGNKKESLRYALIEPYYLAVNYTLNELTADNVEFIDSIFRNKSKDALNIVKNKGGKKKISIEGDFFEALKKIYYNIIHTVIPLDTVRNIIEITYRKPKISHKRIVIIEGIELMDKRVPNIFLRTLEEPSDNNIFILITSDTNKLVQDGMKPLRSRMMELKFSLLSENTLRSILMKRFRLNEEKTALALENSYGSVAKAVKYILDKKSNTSDNIYKVLLSFMGAIFDNNLSQIASLTTLLSEGDYDIADTIREMINILKKSLEEKYLEIENRNYVFPSSISDESIVWTIDELDSIVNTLINTNTQPKMLLYKILGNIYMWLHNYNKNL